MTSSGSKLLISFLLIPSSLFLMRITGWFGLLFLVSLICSTLFCFDYAAELRALERKTKIQEYISVLLFFPQAIFGLTSFLIGISIAVWVLYNTFVEKLPEYSGGVLTFGIAPALILFGLAALKSVFSNKRNKGNEL
ncbi:hypothetical protein Misp06_03378 [Microbulbifer sp. NBRC 101763]